MTLRYAPNALKFFLTLIAVLSLTLSSASVNAQKVWPQRPIKFVVPYLAGTAPDITVRAMTEKFAALLGQPVVVENRAGAGGNLGARQVARAEPDGYTWLYAATPAATNMRMYKDPGFDTLRDFQFVSRIGRSDILFVVNADSPFNTVSDLVNAAAKAPDRLNYGSGGVGTPSHMAAEVFLSYANVLAHHVPYKGAVESVNALLGSQVDFNFPIFAVAYPQVKAGKLRPLAVTGAIRNPLLPDVPTMRELGFKDMQIESWGALALPKGVSPEIFNRIEKATQAVLSDKQVRDRIHSAGGMVSPSSGAEVVSDINREIAMTESMMRRLKLEPQ
jgi:tripartite-type tricarboxylate transporter receptor subunit TctC